MLIELKRCNSIGNTDGILFLISILSGRDQIGKQEVINRCALESCIVINSIATLAFLEYLGYVDISEATVVTTERFSDLLPGNSNHTMDCLIQSCITSLVTEGLFDTEGFYFNTQSGKMTIKRMAFPLAYAALRNFLIMAGALSNDDNEDMFVADNYETTFVSKICERKKKISLEQLLKQQEEQRKRGLEAEEFVLKIDQQRLPLMAGKIRRISDFDVAAGYDIVSLQTEKSKNYDRFIEVKSYQGNEHFFWSENEVEVAKIKGNRYWLCLVDYSKIGDPDYTPEFIQNPYDEIFSCDTWLVDTASFKVRKI